MQKLKFLIYFLGLFILFRFLFVVRQIECISENYHLETGVCEMINDYFSGRSLFFTDFENEPIWEQLLANQQFNQVYQYQKIDKAIVGRSKLYLISKLPDYRLLIGDQRYLLNQSNQLKNDQEHLVLPTIKFMGEAQIVEQGYLMESYHQQFLKLSQAINQEKLSVTNIIWQNDANIELYLSKEIGTTVVILDNTQNFSEQMHRLALILSDKKSRELIIDKKILDLRFNLPVLKP